MKSSRNVAYRQRNQCAGVQSAYRHLGMYLGTYLVNIFSFGNTSSNIDTNVFSSDFGLQFALLAY